MVSVFRLVPFEATKQDHAGMFNNRNRDSSPNTMAELSTVGFP